MRLADAVFCGTLDEGAAVFDLCAGTVEFTDRAPCPWTVVSAPWLAAYAELSVEDVWQQEALNHHWFPVGFPPGELEAWMISRTQCEISNIPVADAMYYFLVIPAPERKEMNSQILFPDPETGIITVALPCHVSSVTLSAEEAAQAWGVTRSCEVCREEYTVIPVTQGVLKFVGSETELPAGALQVLVLSRTEMA